MPKSLKDIYGENCVFFLTVRDQPLASQLVLLILMLPDC